MSVVEVSVGRSRWSLAVRDADLIALRQAEGRPVRDARAAVVDALEQPVRFEAFRRALTPDDRIALVVDESLPHLSELIAGVLEYLAGAGIPPSAVTAISAPGSSRAGSGTTRSSGTPAARGRFTRRWRTRTLPAA